MTVFGLGNPTDRYAGTRHNIGFMVLTTLARRVRARFRHLPGKSIARKEFGGERLVLVKPLLYMNESGVVVREHLSQEPDRFLVVCDDLALPFGRLRLRARGSDGGHKGLASVIYHLGTQDFPRLRIGIGAPGADQDGTEYVLAPFSAEETELLPEILGRAADCCLAVLTQGLEAAMNRYNPDTTRQLNARPETTTTRLGEFRVQGPKTKVMS